MFVLTNSPSAGDRIAELAKCGYHHGRDVCFSSHRDDGAFLGGVVLTDCTGAVLTMHAGAVSERWLARDLLWIMFHFPFVQLGVRSVIAPVARTNAHAMSFVSKVGFELDTVIKDVFPGGDDMMVMRMWREKCRWLALTPRTLRCNLTMKVH